MPENGHAGRGRARWGKQGLMDDWFSQFISSPGSKHIHLSAGTACEMMEALEIWGWLCGEASRYHEGPPLPLGGARLWAEAIAPGRALRLGFVDRAKAQIGAAPHRQA